jgi:outer membrane protein assembly factor BamA
MLTSTKTIATLVLLLTPAVAFAGLDREISDNSDLALDLGETGETGASKKDGRWLPVPIPVRNPTLGTGLVGMLMYLHPSSSTESSVPNATSGIALMATDNHRRFGGIYHDGYYFNDRVRLRAAAGTGEFNLQFSGLGDDPIFDDRPIPYEIAADTVHMQALWRLGKSHYFAGLRETWIDATLSVGGSSESMDIPQFTGSSTTSSLGLVLENDLRDNNYYPTRGHYFQGSYNQDSDTWGSDYSFSRLTLSYNQYWQLRDSMTLAGRVFASDVSGSAPFYLLPTLDLRGFPRGRYRDNAVLSGHLEFRHKFHRRWGYIVFGELGNVGNSVSEALEGNMVKSFGAGIRWQVLKSKALNLGIDVGFSGDDSALYIQVGERF